LVFRKGESNKWLEKLLLRLLKYVYDSSEACFDILVGNHNEFDDKSLFKIPEPINFLDWVIRKELLIMGLLSNEFRVSHRCCFDNSKLLFMLKSKNRGFLFNLWNLLNVLSVIG
jgi:hypothetical protein